MTTYSVTECRLTGILTPIVIFTQASSLLVAACAIPCEIPGVFRWSLPILAEIGMRGIFPAAGAMRNVCPARQASRFSPKGDRDPGMTGSPVGRRHKEVPRAFAPRGDAEGRMPAAEGSTQDAVRREGFPPSHGVMGRTGSMCGSHGRPAATAVSEEAAARRFFVPGISPRSPSAQAGAATLERGDAVVDRDQVITPACSILVPHFSALAGLPRYLRAASS